MKTTDEKRDRRSLSVHEGLEALETSESNAERRLQNQIAALLEGRKELNKEIERLQEKWLNAQRQDDELIRKSRQYDDIQFHLYEIHQRAEADAQEIRDSAKEQAMDAVFVIDDIKEAVAVFQQDLKALKKDLEIGSDTLEDRVTSFLYSLESFENTLDQIKLRFYQDNHLPWEKPEPLEK